MIDPIPDPPAPVVPSLAIRAFSKALGLDPERRWIAGVSLHGDGHGTPRCTVMVREVRHGRVVEIVRRFRLVEERAGVPVGRQDEPPVEQEHGHKPKKIRFREFT